VATSKTSTRKVYYRRSQLQPANTQTLQQLLAAALGDRKRIKDRLETIDAAADACRVINQPRQMGAALCGTLLTFERGSHQLVVEDNPDAASLVMAALQPPKMNGTQQQFVPGVLFFALIDNHVALVQSASLRASGLEQHLAWLLRDQCRAIGPDAGIALVDEPKKATKERIRKSHVKAVSIGRPFMNQAPHTAPDGSTVQLAAGQARNVAKLAPDPTVLSLIKGFMGDDSYAKLDIEDAVFDGNLEVWLEIRYPKRSRAQPGDTVRLMDNLGIALRDQEENTVALQLADGTTVSGNDLKISSTIPLRSVDGVPNIDAFYADMTTWLGELIRNKVISA